MLTETYYTGGDNKFVDNTFDAKIWSAPYMVNKDEIASALDSCNLIGRVISSIRIVDMAYNLNRDDVEDTAWCALEGLPEDERRAKSDYDCIPSDIPYARIAEVDDPLLIRFEDEDQFEICAPEEPEFRLSMNSIPAEIKPDINIPNVRAEILFSPCIGKKIEKTEIEVYKTDKDPMHRGVFPEGERELVSGIILWLEGDLGLRVEPWFDYSQIMLIDKNKELVEILFSELKMALFGEEYED